MKQEDLCKMNDNDGSISVDPLLGAAQSLGQPPIVADFMFLVHQTLDFVRALIQIDHMIFLMFSRMVLMLKSI